MMNAGLFISPWKVRWAAGAMPTIAPKGGGGGFFYYCRVIVRIGATCVIHAGPFSHLVDFLFLCQGLEISPVRSHWDLRMCIMVTAI